MSDLATAFERGGFSRRSASRAGGWRTFPSIVHTAALARRRFEGWSCNVAPRRRNSLSLRELAGPRFQQRPRFGSVNLLPPHVERAQRFAESAGVGFVDDHAFAAENTERVSVELLDIL